ncbi:MAG: sulfatase-like hydrolase/transferase [Lentisphaerales bacterium]|nr:sulfatase-like hydrolase/transferase [Lentisphaerales bacterium]
MRSIFVIFFVLLMASCSSFEEQKKKPNIILIMADDIGTEGIGCYGGLSYKTPKIDKMAEEGVRFNHAYSQPLCTNTRIQLMTGLYNHRNWKYFGILDTNEKTIGHYMQEAGYKTCMAGKWQLQSYDPPDYPGSQKRRGTGMHPKDAGFDEYSLYHSLHTEDKGSRYAKPKYLENGKIVEKSIDKYGPDMWVDYINSFVDRNAGKEHPFFIYYAMALPHWPVVPTPHSKDWKHKDKRLIEDDIYFKDMVEYMDYAVGRIIDHVDAKGLGEDTMIIFYSDNGTHLKVTSDTINGKVAGGKGWTTDAGTRVPLVVRWKDHLKPNVSEELTDSTDILPTCVEIGGSKMDKNIDGISIYPNLLDVNAKLKDHIYCFYDPRPGWDKDQFTKLVFARDKRWKLYEDGRLIDVKNDVLEKKPIMAKNDTKATKAIRAELQKVLNDMQKPL